MSETDLLIHEFYCFEEKILQHFKAGQVPDKPGQIFDKPGRVPDKPGQVIWH
ncbi:MAG: hypothetical protein GX126_07590 [Bacteroidales bacterium]|nr:hypothetical protein [Bacteroidales bacterium]